MDRRALAVALLAAAPAFSACATATDEDGTGTSEDAITSFSSIAEASACVSKTAGRAGSYRDSFVRVVFTKGEFVDLVHIETYDKATGFFESRARYGYRMSGTSELELYTPDTVGGPIVLHKMTINGDGSVTLATSYDPTDAIKLDCDLRAGAPRLKLAVTQQPATRKTVPAGDFPTPPRSRGACTATSAVSGKVFRLGFQRGGLSARTFNKYDDPDYMKYYALSSSLHASAHVYGANGFVEKDLLEGKEAALVDQDDSFAIATVGPNGGRAVGYQHGKIEAKTKRGKRILVFTPAEPSLRATLGAELELACDLSD